MQKIDTEKNTNGKCIYEEIDKIYICKHLKLSPKRTSVPSYWYCGKRSEITRTNPDELNNSFYWLPGQEPEELKSLFC